MRNHTLFTLAIIWFCISASPAQDTTTINFSYTGRIQNWTVPCGVTQVTITAAGAAGGGSNALIGINGGPGGNGAAFTGQCKVTPGHELSFIVGGIGVDGSGCGGAPASGGGGGSFVYDSTSDTLLVISAGGGGGNCPGGNILGNGGNGGTDLMYNTTTNVGTYNAPGGTNGSGGSAVNSFICGAGGTGWLSNGGSISSLYFGGNDKTNAFTGGISSLGCNGGYGGGGGGGNFCGGGGGGYNGGGGGILWTGVNSGAGGGGGGGSYLNGTLMGSALANNTGNGYVSITYSTSQLTVGSSTINQNILCNGANTGSASFSVSGGGSPYTYLWSDPSSQTSLIAAGLSAGTYTLNVHDQCNNTATASVTITQPNALNVSANATANVSCHGGNNGSAAANVSGGTTPYAYLWSDGSSQVNASAVLLSAGTYTVSVTDNCSNTASASVTITQPASDLNLSANTIANVSCNGGNNGSASANITGGGSPYSYLWSDASSQVTASATGLSAATYTVTVTDNCGHSATASITITQPNPSALGIIANTTANVSCHGGNNGSASSNVSGGSTPYTYLWSDGSSQVNASAILLSAGTYTVSVTDNCSNTVSASVIITQPLSDLIAAANTTANVSCNGGNNGSASSNVTGGTSPYTYLWSDASSQASALATGLSAATYTVSVTDNCSNSATASVTITQPTNNLNVSANATANVSCPGGDNGSASANITGGGSPYSYLWSDASSQATASATGLSAATYTVSVTDNCSNSATASVTITQPNPAVLGIIANTTTNVSCHGGNNGSASSNVSGGTTPYAYLWSDGSSQVNASAVLLSAGTYTVSVTDNCSNTASASVIITQPASDLNLSANTIANVSCNGGNNGSASSNVSGGTSPYTYLWSDPSSQTTASATGLSAATYALIVTDNNNCNTSSYVTVTQPNALLVSTSATDSDICPGVCTNLNTTASGGTSPYTYSWNVTGISSSINVCPTVTTPYTTTVTDANNCTNTSSVTVTVNVCTGIGEVNSNTSISVYPNPTNDILNIQMPQPLDGTLSITNVLGQQVYTVKMANNSSLTQVSMGSLSQGIYLLKIESAKQTTVKRIVKL